MSTEVQTAEAKKHHPLVVIRDQIEQRESEFARALPAHIPVERFKRVVLTAVQNNPDLVAADRSSFFNSCMRAAQDGLLPDGRDGAIVIYNTKDKDRWVKKAQWMPMVFGILKKIRNSGELGSIAARVVYGGDKFRNWIDDTGEHVEYEPADNPDTNVIRRVFAMAKTKDGELYVESMSVAEIEKVRAVSRAKDKGPWVEWWDQMAIKTVIRRLAKRLPMSSDLDDLIRRDDELYDLKGSGDAEVKGPRLSMTAALDRLAAPKDQPRQMIEGSVADAADDGPDEHDDAEEDRPSGDGGNSDPEAPEASGAAGGAAEGTGRGVRPSAAAEDRSGDNSGAPQPEPDLDAMVERFEEAAGNAGTLDELNDAAEGLLPYVNGDLSHLMGRALRARAEDAYEDNRKRIVGVPTPKAAPKKASQAGKDDPDYQKGWSDAARGATKCLKQDIRDNPERLAKWQAGFDAQKSQGAEG